MRRVGGSGRAGRLKSDATLLLAAVIWGFAFVAQRAGMTYVGPFVFNAVRFALGAGVLLPVLVGRRDKRGWTSAGSYPGGGLLAGLLAGLAVFLAASLQQVGIVYTTAGKAGFITGLYVILVPILGLLLHRSTARKTWFGAVLALVGLYFLSVKESLEVARGDLLVLGGAFFWAAHVHILARFSPRMNPIWLAFLQFLTCSVLSFAVSFAVEDFTSTALRQAAVPIIYAGVMSVGIAYTLQVVGQREAHPAHAAIILSLESVFAALGGWLVLNETLSERELLGCGLMLCGMILSQGVVSLRASRSRRV